MQILVQPNGTVRCVYGEEINLRELGQLDIRRGSHIEPTVDGMWTVDLTPVNGPFLGPLIRRSDALEAENQWLNEEWLTNAR